MNVSIRIFVCGFLAGVVCSAAAAQGTPHRTSKATTPGDTVESHLGKGYDALKADSYLVAAAEFRAALRLDPKLTLRARFPLGAALFELHQPAEARRELEIVRKETGEHPNVLYYLGRLDLDEHKFDSAVTNLRKAVDKPPFADTAYYLGFAYFQQGAFTDAETWLKQAQKDTPSDARVPYQLAQVYRKEGHEDQAREALKLSGELRERANNESQLRTECAQKLNEAAKDAASKEDAYALCDRMYDSNDAAQLTALGTIYGQHGELEAALKPLHRAAELEPESPQSQYNLALVNVQLGRLEDARAPLAKAVERWPDLFQLNSLYGAVLTKLGDGQAAYAALEHAHQLNPQDKGTEDLLFLTALGLARGKRASKEYAEGLHYFQEAAKLKPQEASPHEGMAEVYELMGNAALASSERRAGERLRRQP